MKYIAHDAATLLDQINDAISKRFFSYKTGVYLPQTIFSHQFPTIPNDSVISGHRWDL